MRRATALTCAAVAAVLIAAPAALAVPLCPGAKQPRVLLSGQTSLESVLVGPEGLYYTVSGNDAIMLLDHPGGVPRVFAANVKSPGGMVFGLDGRLVAGYGDAIATAITGSLFPKAGLLSFSRQTGARYTLATRLSMANGVAIAPDGTFYASQDVGLNVDRVKNGVVQRGWATVASSNGLAVDSTGRYLFVAKTFVPAEVMRIDLADPTKKVSWYHAKPVDYSAGFDGMTRDALDRLYVAANGGQQVWRIGRDRKACAMTPKLGLRPANGPSAVAFGSATGPFPADSLYVVSFDGRVLEIPHATDAPPATG